MSQVLTIARKELKAYFGSPMAAIFIGAFLLAALFSFFWIETFFARNLADIRPLFRWMPVLMIFLVAALTMRQWSEEQRMGTLEILLTLPVPISRLVLGKFLAVLLLVAAALGLTLGLPVTVAMLGNLDWGPVVGGYLGALLMAGAYIAIGLFVSSRTDNQIIALIVTVLVAGLFYLLGAGAVVDFFGAATAGLLRALGTGSRFASIERGVLDLRDLVYYGSLTAIFLAWNTLSLEQKRWSNAPATRRHHRNAILALLLIAANLAAANLWLDRFHSARLDLTQDREFSISPATRDLLANLQEPLLLRGYFSEKTHPLLAPLVPRIKDMLTEYRVAGGRNVNVEFVDPRQDETIEAEANKQYGIKPVPFQVAGRYEASVVNSYFHILVRYGDQYTTLGFDDIIEVKPRKDGQLDVRLRNLEYDLTKSIKKTVYGFQSLGAVFAAMDRKVEMVAVISRSGMPESLAALPGQIARIAGELQREAAGKLEFVEIDPDDPAAGPAMSRQQVADRFGIQPLAESFFSNKTFFLHLLINTGEGYEQVYLAGDMGEAEIRREVEAVIKRHAAGFLKTVGLVLPPAGEADPRFGMMQPPQSSYRLFRQGLEENYNLRDVDLASGRVESGIDVLLLVAPQEMTELQRFAVDQYLMQGGSVIALSGSYRLDLSPASRGLKISRIEGGINGLLHSYGVGLDESLVLDSQNEPLPIPVNRNLGGIIIQEIQRLSYPYFVDIRQDGMAADSPVVANLPAVTLHWPSPILVDQALNKDRTVTTLLSSTDDSWTSTSTDIEPDFTRYPDLGFAEGTTRQRQTLAVAVQGVFDSYFKDKEDPRLAAAATSADAGDNPPDSETDQAAKVPPAPVIMHSSDSARLLVVGASEFLHDAVISISRSMGEDRFLNSLGFLQNMIDWSVEDEELLAIRSRGSQVRLLNPLTRQEQAFWEWLNYGLALLALLVVSWFGRKRHQREKPMLDLRQA